MPEPTTAPPKGVLATIEEMAGPVFEKLSGVTPAPPGAPPEPPPSGGSPPAPPQTPEPPEEDVILPGGTKMETPSGVKSPEDRKNWRFYKSQVKQTLSEYDSKLKDLEAKLASAAPVDTKAWEDKIATLEKERGELSETVGKLSLEHTPQFRQHFTEKLNEAIDEAKTIVGADLAAKVAVIAQLPDDQRKAQLAIVAEDLSEFQQAELATVMRDIRRIEREKAAAIADWKNQLSAKEKLEAEDSTRRKTAAQRQFDAVFSDASKSIPQLQPKDGDAAHNARIESLRESARALFDAERVPLPDRAKAALNAAVYPMLAEQNLALLTELKKANDQIQALRSKSPGLAGGPDPGASTADPALEKMSPIDRIAYLSAKQGFVK